MQNQPLVSVIIPCFNREDYIRETVDSVLNQTYSNIELVVVDDGSADSSFSILESYGDRIKLLHHSGHQNKGQAAAINVGLRVVAGEFVAILDSDDLFMKEKIEKQVDYLVGHPSIGIVYSNGMNISGDGRDLYPLYRPGARPVIGPEPVLEHSAFNLPSNSLVRKSVFDEAGFLVESFRTAQDHDMAVRLAEVAPVGYLDEILWSYRRHGASVSNHRTLERWRNGFIILDNASARFPYSLGVRKRRRATLHFRVGQCLLKERKLPSALAHFILAGVWDPMRGLRVVFGVEEVSAPNS